MAIKKDFNALKGVQFPWVYDVAKDVAEGAFTNLAAAFKNYYDSRSGLRLGVRVGFPRFKSRKHTRQSFCINNDKMHVADHALYVPRLGWVNMSETLRFSGKSAALCGKIMGAVVSGEAGRWYISITVEMEKGEPLKFSQPSVGVDLGVKTLAVLSDGGRYENQALLRSELNHLKRLNRTLARRQAGSQRFRKAKDHLARAHKRIADRRMDHLHKMTSEIASAYEVIGIEDLHVAGMLKNHRLALSLADASFGEIRRQLRYKSEWCGGSLVTIDRFFPSSRLCSRCHSIHPDLDLAEREWMCQSCGARHDRDLNAAVNIEMEALRIFSQTPEACPSQSRVATSGSRLVDSLSWRTDQGV